MRSRAGQEVRGGETKLVDRPEPRLRQTEEGSASGAIGGARRPQLARARDKVAQLHLE